MAFSLTYQWSKQIDSFAIIVVKNHVDHLLFGVFHHLFAGNVAIGRSGTCIEKTQIVIYLCCRADRGTGIVVGRLLFDADNRTQSGNLVDIGTLHVAEKVAGIG